MKERGKALEVYNESMCTDFNYSSSSEMPCKKHPSSSSVGICAYCLKDRLVKLVCSECGEQRLSSCSCSDISSYRNSSCTADVGSVGRISFLIDNEKTELQKLHQKRKKGDKPEEVILLRRSSSSCVEVKRYKGFWKIKRLFRKKKQKGCEKDGQFDDKKPRKSGFRGFIFPVKESDFSAMDDSAFIDLKLDLSSESKPELPAFRTSDASDHGATGGLRGETFPCNGGSCRIAVNDRGGLKRGTNSYKVWKWFSKQYSGRRSNASKKEEIVIFKS
ncbi:unnamed protein product [Coffea canephora]|uniref:Uncharacterized protein n=1 Tax=Coffea canephora TaxID=49390 RepID=A0A068TW80_COFCA|nr:unnamed protein product [Coffea canephora]